MKAWHFLIAAIILLAIPTSLCFYFASSGNGDAAVIMAILMMFSGALVGQVLAFGFYYGWGKM